MVEAMGVPTKEDLVFCLVLPFGLEPSSYERARSAKRIKGKILSLRAVVESRVGRRLGGRTSHES